MSQYNWDDLPETTMPVVTGTMLRRFVCGDQLTVARIILTAGTILADHAHVNEQFSIVLAGRMEFIVDGQRTVVEAGSLIHLPSNARHGATALTDATVIDVFAPPRADWNEAAAKRT
jgi:quercetin dioxygenase-like cupin family protein